MPTVLLTGANRGLGLEFARQYLNENWQVIACCRQPELADQLQQLSIEFGEHLQMNTLDVTDYAAVRQLATELNSQPIDLLLCNSGTYGPKGVPLGEVDPQAWRLVFETNAIAPLKLAEAFAPHVAASSLKKMAFLSSKMGSIADNTSGGSYIYRSSKSALNAVTKSLANDLADQDISVITLHPGWVRTDMGGPNGLIDPPESVAGMREVITQLRLEDSGEFINYDGSPIPW